MKEFLKEFGMFMKGGGWFVFVITSCAIGWMFWSINCPEVSKSSYEYVQSIYKTSQKKGRMDVVEFIEESFEDGKISEFEKKVIFDMNQKYQEEIDKKELEETKSNLKNTVQARHNGGD